MTKEEVISKFHSAAEGITDSVMVQFENEVIPDSSKLVLTEHKKSKVDYYVTILNSKLTEVSNNILISVEHEDSNELKEAILSEGKKLLEAFTQKAEQVGVVM